MHFKNYEWTVAKLNSLRDEIDKKPQFQRGDVWGLPQKQLFLDSIFLGFDIPKLYLNTISGAHKYEVADGQQRLTALWNFIEGTYPLGVGSPANAHLANKFYSDLSRKDKEHFDNYVIITAVAYNASEEDIRELFARLQRGIKLTPPELRNSMPGTIANVIRAMAISHPFFKMSVFSSARFKTDDLLAHAFAIELFGTGTVDLKAPTLARMYREYASHVDSAIVKKVNDTFKKMVEIQTHSSKAIKTKWGLTDVYATISSRSASLPALNLVAERYLQFENKRRANLQTPAKLLTRGHLDRSLYDYIIAFQTSGADKKNVAKRVEVLAARLID